MPSLVCFGRRWHAASDDLPLPSLSLMVFHLVWCIIVVTAYSSAAANLESCPRGSEFSVYLLGVVVVFAAAAAVEAALCRSSLRGTMLQTTERAAVPGLLVLHGLVSCADFAFGVLGLLLAVSSGLFSSPSSCVGGAGGRRAVLVVVIGNWIVLGFSFIVVQSVFNLFSGLEVEESWRRRLAWLGAGLRCIGVAGLGVGADTDPLNDAALAFARVFRHIECVAWLPSRRIIFLLLFFHIFFLMFPFSTASWRPTSPPRWCSSAWRTRTRHGARSARSCAGAAAAAEATRLRRRWRPAGLATARTTTATRRAAAAPTTTATRCARRRPTRPTGCTPAAPAAAAAVWAAPRCRRAGAR